MPATMDTVYFYKFNNYYNRIVKRYDTIAGYGTPMAKQENCNFVHGDGVNSSFTFNKEVGFTDTPDYVVVEDYKGNISRWYVTNSFKTRDRQDKLTLRRDLIADFYNDVLKHSPCLIRKGYINQEASNWPFLFNDEGVRYNKIKKEEIPIKDRSNCSYIVGFIANNSFPSAATVTGTIKENTYNYYYSDLNAFPFKNYVEGAGNNHSQSARIAKHNDFYGRVQYSLKFSIKTQTGNEEYNAEFFLNNGMFALPSGVNSIYSTEFNNSKVFYQNGTMSNDVRLQGYTISGNVGDRYAERDAVLSIYPNILKQKVNLNYYKIKDNSKIVLQLNENTYNDLNEFVGKKIKIGNVIYDCSWGTEGGATRDVNYSNFPSSAWDDIADGFNNYIPTSTELANRTYYGTRQARYYGDHKNYIYNDIRVICETEQKYLIFTAAGVDITTTVDTPSNRTHLREQPFDMFMLINESNISYKVGLTSYTSNHEVNMNMAQAICQAAGSGAYDVQIVPFNPIPDTILADDSLNFLNYDVHAINDANNNVVGHYVLCSSADLKFTLEKDELKFNPTDYKKDFNTRQYRLCSPNQEAMFEFSPAINDGIDTWEITANYRPFASYIKIQPTWGGLYGAFEYEGKTDFRGLVYNSSLCVTQLNDAWSNYVSNNKNFQQLFDNQIDTLTKQQDISLSAMEKTLGLRSFTGMPISSVLRVIGGIKDIDMQRELNNIALSKMETDFKYQMDNIMSMPNTIKKLTNINGDTRNHPFIEIYECSDSEILSFENKIKWTGQTIMTTGFIWDYLELNNETFVQADLIRLDLSRSEETADNHIAIEIANELEKGLYITKESE